MTIAINPTTNGQLYADSVLVARAIKDLKEKCELLAERMYFIGIPNDPANGGAVPVQGFEDAENLTKADVCAALSLILETRDFINPARVQICAQVLRNVPIT